MPAWRPSHQERRGIGGSAMGNGGASMTLFQFCSLLRVSAATVRAWAAQGLIEILDGDRVEASAVEQIIARPASRAGTPASPVLMAYETKEHCS